MVRCVATIKAAKCSMRSLQDSFYHIQSLHLTFTVCVRVCVCARTVPFQLFTVAADDSSISCRSLSFRGMWIHNVELSPSDTVLSEAIREVHSDGLVVCEDWVGGEEV